MSEKMTAAHFAWNVIGGTASAGIGGASTGSVVDDALSQRAPVPDAVSWAGGIAAGGVPADSVAGSPLEALASGARPLDAVGDDTK